MRKHTDSKPIKIAPANATEETFWNVWRSYCATRKSGYFDLPWYRRAINHVAAPLKFRYVRFIPSRQFTKAGHRSIEKFNLESALPLPEKIARLGMPARLDISVTVQEPEIIRMRNVVLLDNGTALMDDGPFYYGPYNEVSEILPDRPPRIISKIKRDHIENFPYIYHRHRSALIRRNLRCIELQGTYFSARSAYYWNFGHFIHDILSLIYYEDLGAIIPGRDRVIAPPFLFPMQMYLFQKVFEGYEIIQFPPNIPLNVEELLIPRNLCKNNSPNPQAFIALAKRMQRILMPFAKQGRRKVCVSRRDGDISPWRRFANVDSYEAKMRELGYNVLEISDQKPETQFALWANTTDIVGIHGTGMMNMIMMPSGGNYTEIAGSKRNDIIIRIAKIIGHRVAMLEDSEVNKTGRMKIDLQRLESMLLDST